MDKKFNAELDKTLVAIIVSKHPFVNPTLKKLASMCKARNDKLKVAEK